jgi:mRNA-degrading endonuclease RelE of RelBE toxin-antitoxin system
MKVYSIVYHKEVAIDYNEAYYWYEAHQKGLGEKFLIAIRDKTQQILSNPEAFSIKSKPGYHETIVNGFPYVIVYRIYKKQSRILITSIHHQKKHPRKKYRK